MEGRPLSGRHRYTIRFPRGQLPPADAFWSLTMYGKDRYLVPNPIDRYAIGDRTKGLRKGRDGSLTIYVQHGRPKGAARRQLAARAERQLPPGDAHLRAASQRAHGQLAAAAR